MMWARILMHEGQRAVLAVGFSASEWSYLTHGAERMPSKVSLGRVGNKARIFVDEELGREVKPASKGYRIAVFHGSDLGLKASATPKCIIEPARGKDAVNGHWVEFPVEDWIDSGENSGSDTEFSWCDWYGGLNTTYISGGNEEYLRWLSIGVRKSKRAVRDTIVSGVLSALEAELPLESLKKLVAGIPDDEQEAA